MNASTASVTVSKVRRSILEVSHAETGEPIQSTIAPKVINSPAVRMLMSSPEDSSPSMPAGASTEQPVTMFPSINAVGARLFTLRVYQLRFLMQLHLIACPMIAFAPCAPFVEAVVGGHDHARFFRYWAIARAESPAIPLLPLTCARSQE